MSFKTFKGSFVVVFIVLCCEIVRFIHNMSARYYFSCNMIEEAERSDERNAQTALHTELRQWNNALIKTVKRNLLNYTGYLRVRFVFCVIY